MDVRSMIQPVLDDPRAKVLIARVTTEDSKQTIIAELYDMLPRPARWVLKQDVFEDYMRQYVFREPPRQGDATA